MVGAGRLSPCSRPPPASRRTVSLHGGAQQAGCQLGPEGCASLVTAVPCKSGATFRSTITPRLGAQAFPDGSAVAHRSNPNPNPNPDPNPNPNQAFPDGSAVAHTSAAEGPGCAVPDELAPAWFLRRFAWYQP